MILSVWEPLLTQITWAPLAAAVPVAAEQGDDGKFEEEKQAEARGRPGGGRPAGPRAPPRCPRAARRGGAGGGGGLGGGAVLGAARG
ncbi:hypothetical protein ABZ914_20655, partial [Spirillospora sp. NPDC046719]